MTSAHLPIFESEPSISDLSTQIAAVTARLRTLSCVDLQSQWQMCIADLSVEVATQPELWASWAIAPLNQRHHIAWAKGKQSLWLAHRLVIPDQVNHYPVESLRLRLALTWWANRADVYINGQLVQSGDIFDCSTRILLTSFARPGEVINIAMRLRSPGHDDGALVQSCLIFESKSDALPEPGFVADELAVLQRYLTLFAPKQIPILWDALHLIRWDTLPDRQTFDQSLADVRLHLQSFSPWLKQRQIKLLGHAHLDLAWLWPLSETWDAAERTFQSVLALQHDFPELIFCHSTPALYAWIEQHRPDLFAAIREKIAAGTWEVVAGLWVEPELNLVSGESLVRQVLYGQRYVYERFGQINTIAWLPDSFGFCWQLPQILKQGGIDYFVTQKLRWNDTTQFPHDVFEWRSPDGSTIFGLTAPPIGTDINPTKMADYASQWEANTGLLISLWLPGVGDHGGGPTRDMLEVARRWQNSPFFPHVEFSTAVDFLQTISTSLESNLESEETLSPDFGIARNSLRSSQSTPSCDPETLATPSRIPVWDDELYLEFHRGCYTTHADQKKWNRQCEILLYQAELYASLASLIAGTTYPKAEIETAWKTVLFNQFHDILPGSSIPEVYAEVNPTWQHVQQTATALRDQSLMAIARCISLPTRPHPDAIPIVVFNPLNWERSQLIEFPISSAANSAFMYWQIYDADGAVIPSQISQLPPMPTSPDRQPCPTILFSAKIASLGYQLFWCSPAQLPAANELSTSFQADRTDWVLTNELLQVTIDASTGDVAHIFDCRHQREVLRASGNQLLAFRDQGQYWDAWNIDPHYAEHPLPSTRLTDIQFVENGPLRSRIRVVRMLGDSTFCQDYVLDADAPLLKIVTEVDWHESQVLIKAAFPLAIEAEFATHDIPFGQIRRLTRPEGDRAKAKWEVPILQWADLSTSNYGMSLISKDKHGVDIQPSQLRLTLLRGSIWPDPNADFGLHQFEYALYPHAGDQNHACTTHRAYEFNQPLIPLTFQMLGQSETSIPTTGLFLNQLAPSLILNTFKQSEDDTNHWVIRAYECAGMSTQISLACCFENSVLTNCPQIIVDWASSKAVTLLEGSSSPSPSKLHSAQQTIPAWRVHSISIPIRTVAESADT
jgi:alpha-mannosidase